MLEPEIPGCDPCVGGKALGRAGKVLDALAKELGVPPLMQFFSAAPEELAGFADDHGINRKQPVVEKWFPAAEGLRSMRSLIRAGENNGIAHSDAILTDLTKFEEVLEVARQKGVRWHVAVDF